MTTEIIETTSDETVVETIDITQVVEVGPDTVEIIDLQLDTVLELLEQTEIVIEDNAETVCEELDVTEIVEVGEQGPIGPQGATGGIAANQTDTIVLASATGTIDFITLLDERSVKWFITVTDATNGLFAFGEVAAIHDGTIARWTHYAKIGEPLDYSIAVSISGLQMILEATNNEAVDLEFSVVRVKTDTV